MCILHVVECGYTLPSTISAAGHSWTRGIHLLQDPGLYSVHMLGDGSGKTNKAQASKTFAILISSAWLHQQSSWKLNLSVRPSCRNYLLYLLVCWFPKTTSINLSRYLSNFSWIIFSMVLKTLRQGFLICVKFPISNAFFFRFQIYPCTILGNHKPHLENERS